jgi:beta-lactamase regulating signal transducer with metallopeptidase domain
MRDYLLASAVLDRLGWVLVHSLWQFTAIALAAVTLLRAMRGRSASSRCWMLVVMLAIMVGTPLATWMTLSVDTMGPSASSASIRPDSQGTTPPAPNGDRAIAASPPAERETQTGIAPDGSWRAIASAGTWWSMARQWIKPWLSAIVGVWCVGVLIFSLRPLLSWFTLRRLATRGASPVPDTVQALFDRMLVDIQHRRVIHILQSTLVRVPVVIGYFRPVMLLPVSVVSGIPQVQLQAILAHELAHVRRHDFLINLVQTLVETVFFYHPAVWWLSYRIGIERENCCDDMAVSVTGNRAEYGKALLALVELRERTPVLAIGAGGGSLTARIRRLARPQPSPGKLRGGSLLVVGLLIVAAVAGGVWAVAPDEPDSGDPGPAKANANSQEADPPGGPVAKQPAPVPKDPAWGKAVQGLSLRLRAEKKQWQLNNTPLLNVDLRYQGDRRMKTSTNVALYQLQFDGVWYGANEDASKLVAEVEPEADPFTIKEIPADLEISAERPTNDLSISIDSTWRTVHANELSGAQHGGSGIWLPGDLQRKPLKLTPGKHTVRLAIFALPTRAGGPTVVRAVSNPVEIEISDAIDYGADVSLGDPALDRELDLVFAKLQLLFQQYYPKAMATNLHRNGIHFEHDTTTFEFPHPQRGKAMKRESPIQRGPKKGGILCSIYLSKGPYNGPLMLAPGRGASSLGPMITDRKVYKRALMAPYSAKRDVHLWCVLKYPPDAHEEFVNSVMAKIAAFEQDSAADGTESNAAEGAAAGTPAQAAQPEKQGELAALAKRLEKATGLDFEVEDSPRAFLTRRGIYAIDKNRKKFTSFYVVPAVKDEHPGQTPRDFWGALAVRIISSDGRYTLVVTYDPGKETVEKILAELGQTLPKEVRYWLTTPRPLKEIDQSEPDSADGADGATKQRPG